MPLYGFFDPRLRGNPVEVHGLRHGTSPCSSNLMIFSVTIAYTSICFAPFLRPLVLSALTRIAHSRRLGGPLWLKLCKLKMNTFPLALSKTLEGEGERLAGRRS